MRHRGKDRNMYFFICHNESGADSLYNVKKIDSFYFARYKEKTVKKQFTTERQSPASIALGLKLIFIRLLFVS